MVRPAGGAGAAPRCNTPHGSARFPWSLWALLAAWAVSAIWSSGGGIANFEAETYLPFHLSKVPLAKRVFDSRTLDHGTYEARELSYVIDALDCHFIARSARLGFPHFLSLSHFLCMLATPL